MDIWELVSLVALAYACYKAGQLSVVLPIVRGIRKEIAEGRMSEADLEEEQQEQRVRLELHDGAYFVYNINGEFIAQGQNFTELFDRFHARFPYQSFRLQKNPDLSETQRNEMTAALAALAERINAK